MWILIAHLVEQASFLLKDEFATVAWAAPIKLSLSNKDCK